MGYPRSTPGEPTLRIANALARRELIPWILLGIASGLVEGGTAAVLLKQHFAGRGSEAAVNFAVAIVSGAPSMANVLSFAWANLAHGRARVPLLVSMQVLFALTVGLIGFMPELLGGLVFTVFSVLIARVVWAGIQTVRATVWIANFPRNTLAQMTSRVVIGGALAVAVSSALVSAALETGAVDRRLLYICAALSGLAAALLYRQTRVRREFRLLRDETTLGVSDGAFSLKAFRTVLQDDPAYRSYMYWMGLYGGGSVMMTSQLVVILSDHAGLPSQQQIMLLTVVPMATMPLFVPFWARRFDRSHTVNFRAQQAWASVTAFSLTCVGVLTGWYWLLWCGALTLGASFAGATFGWNLGHRDFAAPEKAQHYMGVHVTLTGLRGMVAPPLGMLCYQLLEQLSRGAGRYAILIPTALTAYGAYGFSHLRRKHYLTLKQGRNDSDG